MMSRFMTPLPLLHTALAAIRGLEGRASLKWTLGIDTYLKKLNQIIISEYF